MVSLFEKTNKMKNSCNKPMSLNHQEFLKRIKKSLYYGPSNPDRMTSKPLASHVSRLFNETHKNYSLKTLELDAISRIRQQTPCSLILTLIYLERLNISDPAFVKLVSPSELFLVTLMVSTKFYSAYDELEVFASAWAEEGAVDVERLKQLEVAFLNAIHWNILVSENEFYEKLKTVEKLLALKEGLSRGWFTYTELELLMPSIEIAKRIFNYTTILMFSYACSIVTIALSSVILASIPPTTDLTIDRNTTAVMLLQPNEMNSIDNAEFLSTTSYIPPLIENFTINFPIFDRITNWNNDKLNYRDFHSFPLDNFPTKVNPAPIRW